MASPSKVKHLIWIVIQRSSCCSQKCKQVPAPPLPQRKSKKRQISCLAFPWPISESATVYHHNNQNHKNRLQNGLMHPPILKHNKHRSEICRVFTFASMWTCPFWYLRRNKWDYVLNKIQQLQTPSRTLQLLMVSKGQLITIAEKCSMKISY